ncbi:hypothetical protein LCGC14_1139390 [marine sediment metagenome]|uniref:Uncharacterized protein n=1 Tax=marine sediment metagenome TaxID=412755 RepID=A0A0F9Q4I5_9ZZZZ
MSIDFEALILARLDTLSDEVASLGRAIHGAPEEGNPGVHSRISSLATRHEEEAEAVAERLERIEHSQSTLRGWAAGWAAGGAATGAAAAGIAGAAGLFG